MGKDSLHERLELRFRDLLSRGRALLDPPRGSQEPWSSDNTFFDGDNIAKVQGWMSSSASLLLNIAGSGSHYTSDSQRLLLETHATHGIPHEPVYRMLGYVASAKEEWELGLLPAIEYLVTAETFDDFLEHAADYCKAQKKMEAGVLASAVLEDTMKQIARKDGRVNPSGKELDPLIIELAKVGLFNRVQAKYARAAAGVRNHALHAEWDEFDLSNVERLIDDTRRLIKDFL